MADFSRLSFSAGYKRGNFKALYKSQPVARLYLIGAIILLAVLGIGMVLVALGNAMMFDGFAADGAFQLLNPMRRLMAGQVIGRDFSFFHGIGVPFIHVPLYVVFGQGLFGEEMSRWLTSPLLFVGSSFCFAYFFRRKISFAISMAAVITALGVLIIPFVVLPLTSILGVRSVLPVFLLAVMFNQGRLAGPVFTRGSNFVRQFSWYELVAGFLLALGVVYGTEFGVAALIGFLIAHVLYRVNKNETLRERSLSGARVFGLFVVFLLTVMTVLTEGHPMAALTYAFVDLPTDQFWYFGVPPNQFLDASNAWATFSNDPRALFMLALGVVVALLVRKVHRLKSYRVQVQAFIFGLVAGALSMVSMLGYYNNSQIGAFTRMTLLVGGAALVLLFESWQKPIGARFELGKMKRQARLRPATMARLLAVSFVVVSVLYGGAFLVYVRYTTHPIVVAHKIRDRIAGADTNVLGSQWAAIDQQVVPIVQADNNVPVADVNESGWQHGVNGQWQVIVSAGKESSFIHSGQIVYFPRAGRHIIATAKTWGSAGQMLVTLQQRGMPLAPTYDGAPAKMIVAEDFHHNNNKMWSLYTSLVNAELGIVNPTRGGYDYIIHALGPQRRQDYLNDFKQDKPQFVLTFSRNYFGWEEWLQNEHWDLYSLLDQNYTVVKETQLYEVWERKDQPWAGQHTQSQPWQTLKIDTAQKRVDLPKLSFGGVPDVEAYGKTQEQQDQQRLHDLGLPFTAPEELTQGQYDIYELQQFHDQLYQEQQKRENNGPETEAQQAVTDAAQKVQEQQAEKQAKAEGLSNPGPILHLPRPKRQVILIKLDYDASASLGAIPLLGKTTRYFVEPNNTYSHTIVSLRPYAHEIIFPLVISEYNVDSYLRFDTQGWLPGGSLKVTKVQWTPLDTSIQNLKVLTD